VTADNLSIDVAIGKLLVAKGFVLATAESCTGGLIGERITAVPGSSFYYAGGIIAYSDSVKTDLLDVPEALLSEYGAVSSPVAEAMALGVVIRLNADVSLSTTGIAGPSSDASDKPVGLVYIGIAARGRAPAAREFHFKGKRDAVRMATSQAALEMLQEYLLI
jgi:PncC family amidohydrolase